MDITKCNGQNCPIKEKCYRFTSESKSIYQSHFIEIPGKFEIVDGQYGRKILWKCDMFWGDKQESIINTLNDIVK